jgi:hypothetical protein
MSDRVETVCPCCSTRLVVDTDTGEVLAEERPKVDHKKSFDDAMSKVKGGEARRKEAFDKAFDRTQHQEDLLQKKFEEAQKKAAKDKSKPIKPFDLD